LDKHENSVIGIFCLCMVQHSLTESAYTHFMKMTCIVSPAIRHILIVEL